MTASLATYSRFNRPKYKDDCSICLQKIGSGKGWAHSKVDGNDGEKHPLHKGCMQQWLEIKQWCPNCKVAIDYTPKKAKPIPESINKKVFLLATAGGTVLFTVVNNVIFAPSRAQLCHSTTTELVMNRVSTAAAGLFLSGVMMMPKILSYNHSTGTSWWQKAATSSIVTLGVVSFSMPCLVTTPLLSLAERSWSCGIPRAS